MDSWRPGNLAKFVACSKPGIVDRVTTANASIVPQLADCVVQDEKAHEVRLGDLWKERTIVFCFVRHFG
jgi:hypothetical protein